jgi:serine/threonine protein kinase
VVGHRGDAEGVGAPEPEHAGGLPPNPAQPGVAGRPGAPPDRSGLRRLPADVGQVLDDKYELLSRLDEGGMGSVFVAHNRALDVRVAVKVVRADLLAADEDDTVLVDRLLQEARAAARLGHPAIVRTFDFGTAHNGDPYLVMELLDGEDLASALATRGRLRPTKAVRLLLPVAHALAAAHEQGIVHRDLKPENIVVAREHDGRAQPKLIDFGVAKLHQSSAKRLTAAGRAVGTPGYMSPEAARGEDVDARADIWAFCVVLYETLTGRLPFEAATAQGLLHAILRDAPVPLRELGVEDPELWRIVRRGLQRSPATRWPTMRALGKALGQWLLDQGVTDDICGGSLQMLWLQERSAVNARDLLASVPPPPNLMPDFSSTSAAVTVSRAPTEAARRAPSLYEGPALEPSAEEPSIAPRAVRASPRSEPPPTVPTSAPPPVPSAALGSTVDRPKRVPWQAGLAVASALLLVVALGWRFASGGTPGAASPAREPRASATASAGRARPYLLRVESTPVPAIVSEHGVTLGTTPLRLVVAQDTPTVRELVLRAEGYQPATLRPGPIDSDLTVSVPLEPLATTK